MASLGGTETSMDAWVVVQASLPGTWEVEAAVGVGGESSLNQEMAQWVKACCQV